MKFTILAIAIATGLILLLSFTRKTRAKKKENAVLDYIKENPEKSSIKLIRNGEVIVDHQSEMMMPLASTMKIIIAIEYAEQAAAGRIDPDEIISFDQLDQFYVPGTDGGAHMAWFKSMKNEIIDGGVPLREVAMGMVTYSSNANTEWLMEKLGLSNINSRLDSLGIERHSPIYPIVSALFVGHELFPDLEGEAAAKALEQITDEEYLAATETIHQKLMTDLDYKSNLPFLHLAIQKVWSDRLPASTTGEYVGLMKKLNSRTYFDEDVHVHLSECLEGIMKNPANQSWLKHSGTKGGSTAFVLTKALYATDKDDHTTELAYFFNEVGFLENMKLQRSMNQFELKILQDETFSDTIRTALGGI